MRYGTSSAFERIIDEDVLIYAICVRYGTVCHFHSLHDSYIIHVVLPYVPLCSGGGEDIRVTSVDDGHRGASEELSASGSQLDL